jgi:NAD(P)-dependent dehydrogenase (short-subunit alcohol dehydrogenase family)
MTRRGTTLDGSVALVTGGGQGVGRGIARALADQGARVVIADLNLETATAVAAAIEADFSNGPGGPGDLGHPGDRAIAFECDVSRRPSCEAAVAFAVDRFGHLDVLVNNATWTRSFVKLVDTTDDDLARTLDTNLWATFWMMQAGHPHLLEAAGAGRPARVINLCSAAGTEGHAGFSAYAAAKEGVRALTKVAAREWGRDGITVNAICPYANSPAMERTAAERPGRIEKALKRVPMGRLGDCEADVGRTAAFLAGPDASYLTGQTYFVDGGVGMVK